MESLLHRIISHSKSIIVVCIIALVIAGVTTHRFDPFHPKLTTSECMQAPLLCSDKLGWVIFWAVGIFVTQKLYSSVYAALLSGTYISQETSAFMFLYALFDPVKQAFRSGRLRRLVYN